MSPPRLSRRRFLGRSVSTGASGLIAASALTGLTAVAGCLGDSATNAETNGENGDETSGGTGEPGDPTDAIDVEVVSNPTPDFLPGLVHLTVGGTVTWNVVNARHTVTAYHPDTYGPQRIPDGIEPWDSGPLRQGQQFEHTFDEEGIYDYVDTRTLCAPHEAIGVVGRVIVGWPDPNGQPALRHDSAELRGRATTVMEEYNERTLDVLESSR